MPPGWCAQLCVGESGIRGDSARVRALAPGWAERHVAPGAAVTSLSAEPVFIGNTHTQTPPHMQTVVFATV